MTRGGAQTARISVVVPTLAEAENINPLLAAIFAHAKQEALDIEVVFVADGSTDGTPEAIRAWQRSHPVQLIARTAGDGLAGAVLAGAHAAAGEVVVVMDADLSHPPEMIAALAAPVLEGGSDIVIGSRYARGGATPGWPFSRRVASRLAAVLAWPLTDVRDALSGFFAVRRARLLETLPGAAGSKVALQVLMHGGTELRASEVPIIFRDRARGGSKMRARVVLAYVVRLLAPTGRPTTSARRLGLATATGLLADLAIFLILWSGGAGLGVAHLSSFAAAAAINYFLQLRPVLVSRGRGGDLRLHVQLLVVGLMAVFLRGGILGMLVKSWGWPAPLAIFFAILGAALVALPGSIFCLASPPPLTGARMRWRIAALGATAYLFVLRLVYLGLPDLWPEEAYYWNYSRHLALGYLDHPPMVAWINRVGTAVFGNTEFGVRVGALACWLVTSFFTFRLTLRVFGKSSALAALLLLQGLPYFFFAGLMMTPDAPLTACWAGALFFWERALIANRARAWLGIGVCMGLGMLSKYSIGLLGLAALAFMLMDAPSRRWLRRWEPYAATLLALALFSPVIFWNAQHDWASFAFQTSRRLAEKPAFSLHLLLGSAVVLLTPMGLLAAIGVLWTRRTRIPSLNGEPGTDSRRHAFFCRIFTLVPLAVFAAFSLRHETKLEWTGPLWLAVLPPMAQALVRLTPGERSPGKLESWERMGWAATGWLVLLFYGAGLHYLVLGLPGLGYSERMPLIPVGWRELGRQIGEEEALLQRETGQEPLVVGMDRYFISSEVAFYHPDQAASVRRASGPHLFGWPGIMYERWSPKTLQEGRALILVGWRPQDLSGKRILRHCEGLGPVQKGVLVRDGKIIRHYYHRSVSHYHISSNQ